ncbi:unnamed protein product [Leuciscus chuanchicus]
MGPLAKALNILQDETDVQMGWLLPTLTLLINKLERIHINSRYCKPLVDAVLEGLQKRFKDMMAEPEFIAAAILLPKFKTAWTSDENLLNLVAQKEPQTSSAGHTPLPQQPVHGPEAEDQSAVRHRDDEDLGHGVMIPTEKWDIVRRVEGDSRFCKSLDVVIWGPTVLKHRSVTGLKCNAKKTAEAKPPLTPEKISAKGLISQPQ